jgi:hypothetical protein
MENPVSISSRMASGVLLSCRFNDRFLTGSDLVAALLLQDLVRRELAPCLSAEATQTNIVSVQPVGSSPMSETGT